MDEFDTRSAILKSSCDRLSQLLNLEETTPESWGEKDLEAMLRHQLAAPLEFGKTESGARIPPRVSIASIQTFRDLFNHPKPPIELVLQAKDFFKASAGSGQDRLAEQQVAYVLYILCISLGKMRLGVPVSKLSNAEVGKAVKWALRRKWLDKGTRDLFVVAEDYLKTHG